MAGGEAGTTGRGLVWGRRAGLAAASDSALSSRRSHGRQTVTGGIPQQLSNRQHLQHRCLSFTRTLCRGDGRHGFHPSEPYFVATSAPQEPSVHTHHHHITDCTYTSSPLARPMIACMALADSKSLRQRHSSVPKHQESSESLEASEPASALSIWF